MLRILVLLVATIVTAYAAEISSSYASLEKHAAFKPELKSESVESFINQGNSDVAHPVYKGGEVRNQGRARIEPVRSLGPVIKHEAMLSDQPSRSTEVNAVENMGNFGNGYIPAPAEVAYPDLPYAPGYFYDAAYSPSNTYDMYSGSGMDLMGPDTSTFSLLWSQVPDGRTLVNYMGRTIIWIFNSIFVLFLGSLITVGVCSYTNLCSIAFHGVGPIHEEMRMLMTPERLEKIVHAADFVKTAIDKYQKIQKVTDEKPTMRRRRAIFNY